MHPETLLNIRRLCCSDESFWKLISAMDEKWGLPPDLDLAPYSQDADSLALLNQLLPRSFHTTQTASIADLSGKYILIVEDEYHIRDLITTILESLGYEVKACATAAQCLEALPVRTPDLIMLDIYLPDMPGEELYAKIRSFAGTAEVPVLFESGSIDEQDAAALNQAQSKKRRYINKPFMPDQLIRVVRELLGG